MSRSVRRPIQIVALNGIRHPHATCLSCTQGAGSGNLPTAEILLEPAVRQSGRPKLQRMSLAKVPQHDVEVSIIDGSFQRVIHRGTILAQHATLNDSGDSLTLLSRVSDIDFGKPLKKSFYWNAKSNQPIELHLPTIFNEDFDGTVQPNLSEQRHPKFGCGLFIHPESAQTDEAKNYAKSPTPKFWTLPEAAFYLCQILNRLLVGGRLRIENPSLAELKAELPNDESLLRNHEQPFGQYLPAQLDALLHPFGFDWTIDFEPGQSKIRVFERGTGDLADVNLQVEGADADFADSNVASFSLTADVDNRSFNFLSVVGEYERYEATFELQRAWDEDDDSGEDEDADGADQLTKNSPAWKDEPHLARVWRDWVLNEGGDYIDVRTEIKQPFDFDPIFGKDKWIARRRKFEPCLSKNQDGSPFGHCHGVFVEWSDDGGENWYTIDQLSPEGGSIIVLNRECGIRFNGEIPPDEIRRAGRLARVRVTASVDSDTRREQFIDEGRNSLLARQRNEVLNVASKFKFRQRYFGADKNRSRAAADWHITATSEKDDTSKIKGMATDLMKRYNAATISGTVSLLGLSSQAKVGESIYEAIRSIDFTTTPAGDRLPTIVGIRYRPQDLTTDLVIDTFRGRPTLAA